MASKVRVQRVLMSSGVESATVIRDGEVVDCVDRFLAHLTAIEKSPNTDRAGAAASLGRWGSVSGDGEPEAVCGVVVLRVPRPSWRRCRRPACPVAARRPRRIVAAVLGAPGR